MLKDFIQGCREQRDGMLKSIKWYESGDSREIRSEDGQVTTNDWVATLKTKVTRLGNIIRAGEDRN